MVRRDAGLPPEAHDPAPSELLTLAQTLVERHPECFWFWHPDARIRSFADVRTVVRHLRTYGDRAAWADAQDLHRCLSQHFSSAS